MKTVLLSFALATAATAAHASTSLLFDFSRGSGDRAYHFGTNHGVANNFDNASALLGFYVQTSVFKSTNVNGGASPSTHWVMLDDSDPDVVNASAPSGNTVLKADLDTTIAMRTRIVSLSSGDSGVLSQGGFLVGLNDTSATASGWFFALQRTPGGSSFLTVRNFTNGAYGTTLQSGTNVTYGGGAAFLDFDIAPNGSYSLKLFADTAISGTGDGTTRLASGEFDSVTPIASISGTLSGYTGGWQGVGFYDAGGANVGALNIGNFMMDMSAAIPEPANASALLAAFALAFFGVSRRRSRRG